MAPTSHLRAPLDRFARGALVVIGVVLPSALLAYFLWSVGHGILVIFASLLFAVLLDGLARLMGRLTRLGRWITLPAALVIVALLAFGGGWLGGSRLVAQAPRLGKQISHSLDQIHGRLLGDISLSGHKSGSQGDGKSSGTSKVLSYGKRMVGNVTSIVSVTASAITDIFIILILGIYFSIAPGYYLEIAAMLIPPGKRAHVIQVMDIIGHALRRWFLGRIMAMVLVGVLTTAGLFALGVELSFLLGTIAGLLTFVPYLGAIISAVPAILVGLSTGPLMALYVAALFLAVHIIEGYVFTPLVQKRIVHVAPAFLLIAQLLAGLFAGVFGIFVATPLAIVLTIGVQKFYIEAFFAESPHILGDEAAVEDHQNTTEPESREAGDTKHVRRPAN